MCTSYQKKKKNTCTPPRVPWYLFDEAVEGALLKRVLGSVQKVHRRPQQLRLLRGHLFLRANSEHTHYRYTQKEEETKEEAKEEAARRTQEPLCTYLGHSTHTTQGQTNGPEKWVGALQVIYR